jgi:hypothetical protein
MPHSSEEKRKRGKRERGKRERGRKVLKDEIEVQVRWKARVTGRFRQLTPDTVS